MHFEELIKGEFKIFTGAIEAVTADGYIAAVVVERLSGTPGAPHVVFSDDNLAGGHRWPSPGDAIAFAMKKGLEAISVDEATSKS